MSDIYILILISYQFMVIGLSLLDCSDPIIM